MMPIRNSTPSRHHQWEEYGLIVGAIAAAYFGIAELILSVPMLSGQVSPVWPPAGVAMAGLILGGRRVWPGVAIGSFLINYTHGASLYEAVGTMAGCTLQALLGATLFGWLGIHPALDRLRDVIKFIALPALLATTLNPTWTLTLLYGLGQISTDALYKTWGTFWLGDSTGVLILTPVLLLAAQSRRPQSISARWVAERLFWFMLLTATCYGIFHSPLSSTIVQYPIEYVPFPLLLWAVLQFGQFAAVLGSSLVTGIAIWGALEGGGPFVAQAAELGHSPILPLQAFMGVTAITTLMLATAVRQQRQTQQLLKRSEASLSNAQRIAQIGHWDFEPHSGRWYGSTHLYQLLGLTIDDANSEFNQETLLSRVHPDDRDRIRSMIDQAIAAHQPYSADYRLVLPNGEERAVTEQVEVSLNRITGTVQDITNQRQAEMALRESEEKFSKAFGFSPDSITISTLEDGCVIDVNDSFLRLSEYERHDVIDRSVLDLDLWVNVSDRQWLVEQLQHRRPVRNREFAFRTRSGRMIFALVSAELIPLKGKMYILLVARDITEQKRADEQLKLANERDRLLGEMALHIRRTLDLQDMLNTTVSEVRSLLQAGRVFITRFDGRDQETSKGTVVAESVLPDYASVMGEVMDEAVYREVRSIFDKTQVVAIDDMTDLSNFPCLSFLEECVQRYQVKAALGVPIIVNDSLYGLLVAHNCDTPRPWQPFEKELLERLATQVAIAIQQGELYTQVQQLNAGLEQQVQERTLQLEKKMTELQELNQLRDMFLHAVSHDLRTTVMGNLMILRNLQTQEHDPVYLSRSVLERMIQAGDCQLNKLNALQEAYTFKTQGIELESSRIDLGALIKQAIADLSCLVGKNQANLTVSPLPPLPPLQADAERLKRVFKHVLTNAVIHNPPGVEVQLHVEATDDQLTVTIRDNGVGMSPERCDRLFKLCIGSSQTPQLTGISLGLYLCRQIITAHGGTMDVSSSPKSGTTVWFTLPLT